jgi:hypothetical protein
LTALYTVGGTGANVVLTRTVAANNDATLNIAIAAGLGVSAITTSTDTTAGVGGVKLTNNTGDGKDFEGISLGNALVVAACIVKASGTGGIDVDVVSENYVFNLQPGGIWMIASGNGELNDFVGNMVITAQSNDAAVEVTIIGQV